MILRLNKRFVRLKITKSKNLLISTQKLKDHEREI